MNMTLIDQLNRLFQSSISYHEAAELCKGLYCSGSWLPDVSDSEFSKENICETFATLANQGKIRVPEDQENLNDLDTYLAKEHWLDLIQKSFKSTEKFYDDKILSILLQPINSSA